MMLTLRRLSSADLTALQEGPDEIVPLLRDVDGFEQVAATAEQHSMEQAIAAVGREVWSRYLGAEALLRPMIAAAIIDYLKKNAGPSISKPEYLDLGQSWHILHTLISGSADAGDAPEAALLGGTEVGPGGGYGPVRVLHPDGVCEFAEVLKPLDVETLKKRVDPDQLRKQGVTFAQTEFDLEVLEFEIEDHFPALKKFVQATVKKQRGLLLILEQARSQHLHIAANADRLA